MCGRLPTELVVVERRGLVLELAKLSVAQPARFSLARSKLLLHALEERLGSPATLARAAAGARRERAPPLGRLDAQPRLQGVPLLAVALPPGA